MYTGLYLLLRMLLFLVSPTWHHVSFVTRSKDWTFPLTPVMLKGVNKTNQSMPLYFFYCQSWILSPTSCHSSVVLIITSLLDHWTHTFSRFPPCLHNSFTFHTTQRIPFPKSTVAVKLWSKRHWKSVSHDFPIGKQEPTKQTKTLGS